MKNKILTKLTAVSTVALTLLSVSAGAPVSANARKATTTKPRVERVSNREGTKAVLPKLTNKTSKKGVKKALKKHIVKKIAKRNKRGKRSNKSLSNAQMYKFLSSFYNSKGSIKITRKNKRVLQHESHSLLGGSIPFRNRMQLNVIGSRNVKAGTQYLVSYIEPVGKEDNFTFYGYVQTPNKKVNKATKKLNKSRKGTKTNKSSKITTRKNKKARKHVKRSKRSKRSKRAKRDKLNKRVAKRNKKVTKKVVKNATKSNKNVKGAKKVNHKATSKAPVSVHKSNTSKEAK